MRLQPNRKSLSKVFSRVRLRVPLAQVLHMVAAGRPRAILRRIASRGMTKQRTPARAPPQSIRGINGVTGFVAQDTHLPIDVAAFHNARHLTLKAHQARMDQVEWHGETRHAIG